MTYFGQEMVAWRAQVGPGDRDGRLLRAPGRPPGVRRPRRGRRHRMSVPRLAVERRGPQRLHPLREPAQPRQADPHHPVVERNESIYVWHDVRGTRALLRRPRRVRRIRRRQQPPPTTTRCASTPACTGRVWSCIRSTCSKTASTSPTSSSCTRRPSCPCSPSTISRTRSPTSTSPSPSKVDDGRRIEDVNSGVEAINGGLGVAVTKSWGMVDNRTITAVTPVDDDTSDVRFSVYIGRTPGDDRDHAETEAQECSRADHSPVHPGRPHLVTPALRRPARAVERRVRGLHRHSATGPSSSTPTAVRQRRRTAARRPTEG